MPADGARMAPTPSPQRQVARALAGFGIAADALLFVLKAPGPFTATTCVFALWLMLPWLVLLGIAWRYDARGMGAGAALAALFEAVAFHTTFVAPTASTAALVYAVKPVWQLALIALAMAIAGWRGRGGGPKPTTGSGR